ncbi:MAG: diadenosine tetraphosphate hydrolase [Actinomycetia bacterium]|nr:diadenosine tetraphosphate hydrolase [Actinomycetes bacterium]
MAGCDLCAGAQRMDRGDDPYAVARLETGFVRLHEVQYFRGYTVFAAKTCVAELHELERGERDLYLAEMSEVAHALSRAFRPRKLNYELLGNSVPHLHWHLVPRYDTDPHPRGPIWEDLSFLRNLWTGGSASTVTERDAMRTTLLQELERADVRIERAFV